MKHEVQIGIIGTTKAIDAVQQLILSRFPDSYVSVPKPDREVAGVYRLYISASIDCSEEEIKH